MLKFGKPAVIKTVIDAGLGNQMFQYAAARRLALACGGDLFLVPLRQDWAPVHSAYRLRKFKVAGQDLEMDNVPPLEAPPRTGPVWVRAAAWMGRAEDRALVREQKIVTASAAPGAAASLAAGEIIFNRSLLTRRKNTTLRGYWQNEKYFCDIAGIIKADFTLAEPLDGRNLEWLACIQSGPSAFLHVRRGDYLTTANDAFFGTCTAEYYRQAVEILRHKYGPDMRLFVFGNDHEWIREHQIGGKDAVIIDWNGNAPERDLMLMRACQHAVVANSSFSWWGAWLGEWPGQTVIAPRVWFKGVPDYRDIVPQRWIRL